MGKFLICSTTFLCVFAFVTIFSENRDVVRSSALIVVDSSLDENESKSKDDVINYERFYPTKEWQTIKPGQSIPQGLHVRMNLQTGLKEAKLLDNTESEKSDRTQYDLKTLKKNLKKIKSESPKNKTSKYRHIEELKKDFETLKLNVQTEGELITKVLERYAKDNEKQKIHDLQEMEFMVHKYDTANNFVDLGGLDLLLKDLNSTNDEIKSLVVFTLGSAMQGNPPVQVACMEHNLLPYLLRLITQGNSLITRKRSLFALSGMVRQFPLAQHRLIENGGANVLGSILKEPITMEDAKIQIKVVTLIQDLLSEEKLAKLYLEEDKAQKAKLLQYQGLNLGTHFSENSICESVPKLLDLQDYDTQEKVIQAMLELLVYCHSSFKSVLPTLYKLSDQYQQKAEELGENKGNDSYFLNLYDSVNRLIQILNNTMK